LLFHVVRVQFFRAFWGEEREDKIFYIYNLIAALPCVILAIWYPHVGSMLGYAGGVTGLFTIYLLPVLVNLKRTWLAITNPILLKMLEKRIILSYDDIDKYEQYYNNPKLDLGTDVIPKNDELRKNLIEPEIERHQDNCENKDFENIPINNSEDFQTDSPNRSISQMMTEVLNEVKIDEQKNQSPTKLSFIQDIVLDS